MLMSALQLMDRREGELGCAQSGADRKSYRLLFLPDGVYGKYVFK